MTYTHIQFIGYSIETLPENSGPDKMGPPIYLGLADPRTDILARCALMERAITTARDNLPQISPPPGPGTVLKVFMAPEFYLRGDQGAYQMDDVQTAIASLQALVADDQWSDWLLVFGTILGVSAPPNPSLRQEIYNFALIQQGGVANSGAKGARVVMKELKSGIDFISGYAYGGGLLLGQVNPLAPGGPSGPGREAQQVSYDGAGIFELPQIPITFAADICLDHAVGRLVNSPQLPGEHLVQVQLIPSCGMSILPADVVAGPGGYVFNVDGHEGAQVELQRVGHGVITDFRTYLVDPGVITVTGVSPPVDVTVPELYRQALNATVIDAGAVVIYAADPIPSRHRVPGKVLPIQTWNPQGSAYAFDVEMVVDAAGNFVTAMCKVSGGKVNFGGRRYLLPLSLNTKDSDGQNVTIQMRLQKGGGDAYDSAIYCVLDLPDYDFNGPLLRFDAKPKDPPQPLQTIWQINS